MLRDLTINNWRRVRNRGKPCAAASHWILKADSLGGEDSHPESGARARFLEDWIRDPERDLRDPEESGVRGGFESMSKRISKVPAWP